MAGGRAARGEYELRGGFLSRSVQVLAHAVRTARVAFAIAVGAAALFSLSTVYFGTLLGTIVDSVVIPGVEGTPLRGSWGELSQDPRRAILWAGALFLAIGVANAVLVWVRRATQGAAVARVSAHHRGRVADALASLPLGWHRANSSGRVISALSSDSDMATSALHPFAFTVGSFVMMAAAGVTLVVIDPWLALTAMTVVPVILGINFMYERIITPHFDAGQNLRAEVSTIAHESFDGGTVVKALGAEARESERFDAVVNDLREADIRVGRTAAWFEPMMDLVVPLGAVALMVVGTIRAAAGAITPGDVVTAIYLVTLLAVPIRGLGWVMGQMPEAHVAFRRIGRIHEAATEVDDPGVVAVENTGPAHVRLEGADIGVDEGDGTFHVIVHGVNLELVPGSVTALVGPTGSGKSTLALATTRLARAARGQVSLDTVHVGEVAELGTHVSLVPQTTFLFADTVRENVTLGENFTDDEVWGALRLASVDDVIAGLSHGEGSGLDATLSERGMNLSGGQRQRVAIARALVRRPRLLVLDDATSAVDPEIEQRILRALRGRDGGPTVLLIAYRLASILLADQVVHLDAGRVTDAGSHAELSRRDPGYRALVTAYEEDARKRARAEGGASE